VALPAGESLMRCQSHMSHEFDLAEDGSGCPRGLSSLMELPWFAVISVVFPALSLYAANLDQVVLGEKVSSILLAELFFGILSASWLVHFRDIGSSDAFSGFPILGFFPDGHNSLERTQPRRDNLMW